MALGGPPRGPLSPRCDGRLGGFSPITPEDKYKSEAQRKRSFDGCALNRVFVNKLVSAGFVYTGVGDKVRCFQCGVTHSNWHQGYDIPFNIHQQLNPCCQYLQLFVCKRKTPRTEMVVGTNTAPWKRKTHLQLYREATLRLYQSDGARQVVQSFPTSSTLDHNPIRGLVYEELNVDMTIPSMHPSPAHSLPPQSMQVHSLSQQSTQATTDDSAILIGDVLKPLQPHHLSTGIYKNPTQTNNANVSFGPSSDNQKVSNERNDQDYYTCKICDSAPVKCVYLPCGHVGACRSCVSEFQKRSPCCPFCNVLVVSTHEVFFP